MELVKHQVRRVFIAISGGTVLVVGVVLVPYPGPGWLVIFAGLAILATEFAWARSLLRRARRYYKQWRDWLSHQPVVIRLLLLVLTGAVIVTTIWLFNGFGMVANLLNVDLPWVHSPLF